MKMLTIYPEECIINFVIRIIGTFLVFFSNAYMLRYIVNGVQEAVHGNRKPAPEITGSPSAECFI